jgi:hypothetical protein
MPAKIAAIFTKRRAGQMESRCAAEMRPPKSLRNFYRQFKKYIKSKAFNILKDYI